MGSGWAAPYSSEAVHVGESQGCKDKQGKCRAKRIQSEHFAFPWSQQEVISHSCIVEAVNIGSDPDYIPDYTVP